MQMIWDGYVRVFHWLLVASVGFAWWSAEQGGDWMDWHVRSGYAVLGLVLFRLIWGFAGSAYARFAAFIRSPRQTLRYLGALLRGREPQYAGHNPVGGWAVLLLLLLCAVQAGTGLFANDDILTEGPLLHLVGYDLSTDITRWHKALFNGLLAVVGLHVAGVLFHQLVRREGLIQGMITGRKDTADAVDVEASGLSGRTVLWRGLLAAAVAAAGVWLTISL